MKPMGNFAKCIFALLAAFCAAFSLAQSSSQSQTIQYRYDELGRLVTTEDSRNGDRVYKYDAAGNRTLVVAGFSSSSSKLSSSSVSTSCSGVSLKIEAENYSSMFGVQAETTTDAGGGKNLGYMHPGDWMLYENSIFTAPVSALYKLTFRVASTAGGIFRLHEADGSLQYGTISVPVTGGLQVWADVTKDVFLNAGSHKFGLTVEERALGFNLNWFRVAPSCGASSVSSFYSSLSSGGASYSSSSQRSFSSSSIAISSSSRISSSVSSWSSSTQRSSSSQSSSVDAQAPTAPGTPIVEALNANSATISWAPAADNIGVSGYEYSLNNGAWQPAGSSTSIVLNALTSVANYKIKIRAFDGAGNIGLASNETAFTTPDNIPPSAPSLVNVSNATHGKATLNWQPASDNVAVADYEYTLNAGVSWTKTNNLLAVTLTGLNIGQQYLFAVRAIDNSNNVGDGVSSSFIVTQLPAPTVFAPILTQDCAWRATWNPVVGATKYYYVEESAGAQMGRYVDGAPAITACLTGQPNSTKPLKVSACDDNGCSDYAYFSIPLSSSLASSTGVSSSRSLLSSSVPVMSSKSSVPIVPSSSSSSAMAMVGTPRFSPASSTVFSGSGVVSLTTSDNVGATILYSINGSTYTPYPAGGITVTTNSTIKAKAIKAGMLDSSENTANYYVSVLPPKFGTVSGTNFQGSGTVSILPSDTPGAMTHYSINGSGFVPFDSGTLPISVNSDITIKATKAGMNDSNNVSASFTVSVLPPVITPYASEFYQPVNVSIAPGTVGSSIYYTTDFSTATNGSTSYGGQFTLTSSATVKARAYKTGMKESSEAVVYFNIVQITPPTVLSCTLAGPGAYKASWKPVSGANFYKYTTLDNKTYNTGTATSSIQSSGCAWVKACISETVCSSSSNF